MRALETVLAPIVWLMESLLRYFIEIFSSTGVSILLLSFTFSLLLLPLQKMAQRTERRISDKMNRVSAELLTLKKDLKGEQRFLATEKIYKNHDYHPIQSIGLGVSFLVVLPVLISAIILFAGSEILVGKSFLFIPDLSEPDSLLGPINILPVIMSSITLIDARYRFKNDKKSQLRFLFISLVLLVIVYNLASGLVLYWTGSNIFSFLSSRLKS